MNSGSLRKLRSEVGMYSRLDDNAVVLKAKLQCGDFVRALPIFVIGPPFAVQSDHFLGLGSSQGPQLFNGRIHSWTVSATVVSMVTFLTCTGKVVAWEGEAIDELMIALDQCIHKRQWCNWEMKQVYIFIYLYVHGSWDNGILDCKDETNLMHPLGQSKKRLQFSKILM